MRVPRDVIDWLGALIDLAFDPSWSVERRRALVVEAMSLFQMRGTIAGIERYVEILHGVARSSSRVGWSDRRAHLFGRPGSVLGCGLPILGTRTSRPCCPTTCYGRATLIASPSTSTSTIDATPRSPSASWTGSSRSTSRLTRRTGARSIFPDARLGIQSRVGLDLVLGAATAPRTQLGNGGSDGTSVGGSAGLGASPGSGGILGLDTVLGGRRPSYVPGSNEHAGGGAAMNEAGDDE